MEATILYGPREAKLSNVTTEGDRFWIGLADLGRATGWELKPQGLCQGDTCVPVPKGGAWVDEAHDRFDLAAFARHLGQPVLRDEPHGVWAFGEPAGRSAAPASVEAPDFRLPDLDGREHSLSEHRGKKVFLFCWASW